MENEKKTCVSWIKEHKAELIVTGVSMVAIIAVILGIKNRDVLEEVWASLKKLVEKAPKEIPLISNPSLIEEVTVIGTAHKGYTPRNVDRHIRNLPEGWKASPEKLATAANYGYILEPGQTWVDKYRAGGCAA